MYKNKNVTTLIHQPYSTKIISSAYEQILGYTGLVLRETNHLSLERILLCRWRHLTPPSPFITTKQTDILR